MLKSLAAPLCVLVLAVPGFAQAPVVTLRVDAASREVELSATTDWLEKWSPGPIDVWIASRKQGTGWTVEYELSARAPLQGVGAVTIEVPGYPKQRIEVGMTWPAGRSLSGRVGEELPLYEDWEARKRHFGPLEIALPNIPDVAAQAAWATAKLAGLRAALAARTKTGYPVQDWLDGLYAGHGEQDPAWRGPWVCYTAPDPGPGAPGGSGIDHTTGWQDNEPFARLACAIEAVAMGRMWCFHNADGSFFSVDQFRAAGKLSPNCTSEANIKPPEFGGAKDPNDPLWLPISISHYPRVLRYCQAAYEMTGSRLARRHLIQLAETARLQFSECGQDAHGGGWIAWNLTSWEVLAAQHPHSGLIAPQYGLGWDRNHGWMLWAAAEAKKAGMPWTDGWKDWSKRMVGAITLTQMPNGIIGRAYRDDASKADDVCALMHEAVLGLGLLALHVQAQIPIPTILPAHARTLYQKAPTGPYHGEIGPLHFLVVAPRGGEPVAKIERGYGEPSIQPPTDTGDPILVESYLAAVSALSADASFLESALHLGVPAPTRAAKVQQMSNPGNSLMLRSWQAYLLAQMQ
ncbi:MAG: hypothetical protein IPJ19_04930 [Planctomycetes bacterium]|nr:hypothetical protein [Planctomycetota bacterium]